MARNVRSALLLLAAVALALASGRVASAAKRPMNVGAYAGNEQACITAIWAAADRHMTNVRILANCLRWSFHDAATWNGTMGGADASLRFSTELSSPADRGLATITPPPGGNSNPDNCQGPLTQMLADVQATPGCAGATFADIIHVGAAAAVFIMGGPPVSMCLGRTDIQPGEPFFDTVTSPDYANNNLPGPCFGQTAVINFWASRGFSNPALAAVTLNGAHGMPGAQVRGNKEAIPAPNPPCFPGIPGGGADLGSPAAPMLSTGAAFDGSYYTLIQQGRAPFESDVAFVQDPNTQSFAANPSLFFSNWQAIFKQMTELGVESAGCTALLPTSFPPQRVSTGNPVPSPSPPPPTASPPPPTVTASPPPAMASSPPPAMASSPPPAVLPSPAQQPAPAQTNYPAPSGSGSGSGSCSSVWDVITGIPKLSQLVAAIEATGTKPLFTDNTLQLTVFAPSNEAINAAYGAWPDVNTERTSILGSVAPGIKMRGSPAEVQAKITGSSLNLLTLTTDIDLTISVIMGQVIVAGPYSQAMVVQPNIDACKSMVHIVDNIVWTKAH